MVDKLEAVYEERECLAPDAYDIGLMKNGGMPGCPCCGKTAVTFSRFFPHSGIYQAYVHCAHCDMQVFKNARDHDEARQLAKNAWSKRPDHTPANGEQVERVAKAMWDIEPTTVMHKPWGRMPDRMEQYRRAARAAIAAMNLTPTEDARSRIEALEEALERVCDAYDDASNYDMLTAQLEAAVEEARALGNKETDRHG